MSLDSLFRGVCRVCISLLALAHARAAEPTLDHLFPAGGQLGSVVELEAGGKFEPWPVRVWSSGDGLRIEPGEKAGQFAVHIDSSAAIGPHWLRVYNEEGVSDLRPFMVGRLVESFEIEPNDRFAQAVPVGQLPVTFNGRLARGGDVDCYALELRAGQCLVAAVDGYGLRSPIDPHLHLFDAEGRQVAFVHDSHNLDPVLNYTVERDGVYTLQVAAFAHPPEANVRFAGSAAAIYRLTLTVGPFGRHAFPTAAEARHERTVRLHGWNLPIEHTTVSVPATNARRLDLAPPDWPGPVYVDVVDAPQLEEQEPNDATPQVVELGPVIWLHGRLDPPGDVDRFQFHAAKGEQFTLKVESLSLGFPADTILAVERDGKELARNDDSGGLRDPVLNWTAGEEGPYVARVQELFGHGSESHIYRLVLERRQGDFTVTSAQSSILVRKGKETELKLTLSRLAGHKDKLDLMTEGLPEGVSLKTGSIPDKSGDVTLTLAATGEAPPFSGPVRFLITEEGGGRQRAAWFDPREDLLRGDLLINGTDQLWLTVRVD